MSFDSKRHKQHKPEVCEAIIAEFQDEVLMAPRNPAEWRAVARRFEGDGGFIL